MKIVVLGSGNVAQQLLGVFQKHPKTELVQWYSRTPKTPHFIQDTVPVTHRLDELVSADLYILALSDDALSTISKKFQKNELVVHMAGGMPLDTLQNAGPKGVWYPIQSFTQKRTVDFKNLPFSIEGSDEQTLKTLINLTDWIGGQAIVHPSNQRLALHLAAVVCNNFTNHLYTLTQHLCQKHQIDFALLYPLIQETSRRLKEGNPEQWQTGPARRNDNQTLKKHGALLESPLKEIYLLLTKTIQEHYGKKEL